MKSSRNLKKLNIAIGVFASLFSVGCATLFSEKGKTPEAAEPSSDELAGIKKTLEKLSTENEQNKQLLATSQMELQSMREQLRTAKRNIQVLNRAERSGIYYDDSADEASMSPVTKKQDVVKEETVKPIDLPTAQKLAEPSDDLGRTGFAEEGEEKESQAASEVEAPAHMLADAQQKIGRSQFGEAVVVLNELQTKFPNFNDGGEALILMAESWTQLKEYNNALTPLRSFYLKHPNSSETLRAKITEAEALEGLGLKERATHIYREIVGLGPQTAPAQKARAALIRLRDIR